MPTDPPAVPVPAGWARAYLGAQAVAGALWWVAVLASDEVRTATLGGWHPALLVGPDLVLFVGASAVAAATSSRAAAAVAAVWTGLVTVALTAYGLVEQVAGWGVVAMTAATLGTAVAAAGLLWGGVPTGWFFRGPFAFRVADPGRHHLARSLVQLVVFWTTFFVVVPLVAAAVERRLGLAWSALDGPGVVVVGAVVFALASVVGLWSCVTMAVQGEGTPLPSETARHLVVAGPYRYVRNPMAVAGGLQTAAVGLVTGSWIVIVLAVAGAVAWDVAIRPREEADLAARLGPPYDAYRAAVRCWIPTRPAPPSP